MPISKEDAVFKSEYFKYYVEGGGQLLVYEKDIKEPQRIPEREVTNVVIVDPAKTVKLSSADSAVLVIGIHRQSQKIFVRNVVAGKMEPDELLENMFEQCQTYRAMVLGVETTGIDRWISQPIENIMRSRVKSGMSVPIFHSISASKGTKPKRVASLGPYYKMGFIYHNKECCQKLESQLEMFPRSKLWDVMDGLSHLMPLMDEFAYYFDPEDYGDESADEEFAALMDEDEFEKPLTFQAY